MLPGPGWKDEFLSLYASLAKDQPDFVVVAPETLSCIADELGRQEAAYLTERYTAGVTGGTVAIVASVTLFVGGSELLSQYSSRLPQLSAAPVLVWVPLIAFGILALIYCVVFPVAVQFFPTSTLPTKMWVNLKSRRYRVFAALGIYLASPVVFLAAITAFPRWGGSLSAFLSVWLMPLWMALAFFLGFPAVFLIEGAGRKTETSQYIALGLLRIIQELDQIRAFAELSSEDRIKLIARIRDLGYRISWLCPKGRDPLDRWAGEQGIRAADNFLLLMTWVYFPQTGTLEALKLSLFYYLKIFITCNLHELPRGEIDPVYDLKSRVPVLSAWKKFLVFLLALVYLGLPPVVLISLAVLKGISIPASANAPLVCLYLIWVVCGAVAFAERFHPDSRSLFFDLLKAAVGRK